MINLSSMTNVVKKVAYFRFYAELNDFLPYAHRYKSHPYRFWGKPSIKNTIQAQGVPHTEVELILANGEAIDFDYHLNAGDYISVYPFFKSMDIGKISLIHHGPFRDYKFVIDANLGKLTKYVRMLGFDSLYSNHFSDEEIMRIASEENRIILTRDIGILMHNQVTHGYFLRSPHPKEQLSELIRRFDLLSRIQPFTRCMNCNGVLMEISKASIKGEVKEDTYHNFSAFFQCCECHKIYWKGSHFDRMLKMIKGLQQYNP